MPSVLIVDDSEMDRRLAGGLLTNTGRFEVRFAENGSEALATLRTFRPALVLTDLHMPDRGGLSVIEACRLHYENLPVVLMTGQGSEHLAVQALRAGAAGYVAKHSLAERLVDTLDEVLSHAEANQSVRRLMRRLVQSEFNFELESNPQLVPPLVDMAEQMLGSLGLCNHVDCMRVGTALREVALAAMLRGNLELPAPGAADEALTFEAGEAIAQRRSQSPFAERRVRVDLAFEPQQARFTIRHAGPRLWPADVLATVNDEQLEDPVLRPVLLMRAFCDEVAFGENDVTLVKRGACAT